MKKFIQTCALFFLAFCATQLVWNMLFLKNIGIPYAHNIRFSTKYVHYLKKEKEYNTLFLGSSRTYRQINPAIIDADMQDVKMKSYNLGAPGTFNPEALYLFEMIMENTSADSPLRYVFVELTELSPMKFENWFAPQSYYYLDKRYTRLVLDTYLSNPTLNTLEKAEKIFPFVQGFVLNHLFLIHPLQFRKEPDIYAGEKGDGYYPLDLELEQTGRNRLLQRNKSLLRDTSVLAQRKLVQKKPAGAYIPTAYAAFLNDLVTEAGKHKLELYFIIPPKLKTYREVSRLAENIHGNRVIDLGNGEQYPAFYFAKYCFNEGHFNHLGAEMYSRILAEEIRKKLGQPLHPK